LSQLTGPAKSYMPQGRAAGYPIRNTDDIIRIYLADTDDLVLYHQDTVCIWQIGTPLLLEGTFSTNALNLVLIIAYGVTNTDKTFAMCLSFARSESKISFDFILSSVKMSISGGRVSVLLNRKAKAIKGLQANHSSSLPHVTISDQAKRLVAALPICLPSCEIQTNNQKHSLISLPFLVTIQFVHCHYFCFFQVFRRL